MNYQKLEKEKAEKMEMQKEFKEQKNMETIKEVVYPIAEIEILPEKVICPECVGLTTEGLVFCEKCGGELEPMEPEEYERLRQEYKSLYREERAAIEERATIKKEQQ